jgi:AraC-like DNA-binding protein
LFVTGQEKSMKKKIREKLERMGLTFSDPSQMVATGVDPGFVELCVIQLIEGESFTVKDLAEVFEVSEDWVLKNFKDATGMFRKGKVIRYPYEAVKAKIRSMLNL